jgi:hypothetical protein
MDNNYRFDMADSAIQISSPDCKKNCVTTALPANPVVAMAYVPFQLDKTSYSPEVALREGTLFCVLNKPFCGRSIMNER